MMASLCWKGIIKQCPNTLFMSIQLLLNHCFPLLGYAGPLVGAFAINSIAAIASAICVYAFLSKDEWKSQSPKVYALIHVITKPLHRIIRFIANKSIAAKRDCDE